MSDHVVEPMPDDAALQALAAALAEQLLTRGWRMAVAESCTGGWIAKTATDLAGSSRWFEMGVVSYSNAAKQRFLGVTEETLTAHGAVSEAVVREMVQGVLERSGAEIAVATSGIAGPDGSSPQKPVGTVWFAVQRRQDAQAVAFVRRLPGDRESVRRRSVQEAYAACISLLDGGSVA